MELLSTRSTRLVLNSDNSDCDGVKKHSGKNSATMSNCHKNINQRYEYFNNIQNRMTRFSKNAAIILLLSIGFSSVTSSRDIIVTTVIPGEAELGKHVDMICRWDIHGGKSLYSVKWYKDGHEFFRYVPDNVQRIQTFSQPGVKLDSSASRENSIRLTNLTLNTTGQYKCEVSTEAPAFAASFKTGNLTVISLPKRGPEITGLSSHYAVGENVTANCSAWPSVPKADLHWTINGKPVPKEHMVTYQSESSESSEGVSVTRGLRLQAQTSHFSGGGGTVKIRCVAKVGSRPYATEEQVKMNHVNNQRLSAGNLHNVNSTGCTLRLNCIAIVIVFIVTFT